MAATTLAQRHVRAQFQCFSQLVKSDLSNVYLARAPRKRMEAEQLRDAALASAGLLSRSIGGPSVYPPQPASVTTEGTYG